jgi:integrase
VIWSSAEPILEWWADKRVREINIMTCDAYVKWRTSQVRRLPNSPKAKPRKISVSTARHGLKCLRTALSYYRAVDTEFAPPGNVLRSWATAKAAAQFTGEDHGLHIMRHTAATWAMMQGLPVGQIAKYLGMSVKTLEQHYGQHHPDYQQEVASFSGKQRRTA